MLLLLASLVLIINVLFPEQTIIHYILYGIGVIFYILCIRFFRYPNRVPVASPDIVLSAADGHVVVIEEVYEDEFYHGKCKQVSVFMSPLNVHVNWYPITGEIMQTKYHRGSHIPAYRPKSSRENERMSIVIKNEHGQQVTMVQIAGMVARRVFTNARPGSFVFQGEEAGIIKFGSRVDLFLPADSEILVHKGQNVRACETPIARLQGIV
jgi:phosphatidylserine decarboxylase